MGPTVPVEFDREPVTLPLSALATPPRKQHFDPVVFTWKLRDKLEQVCGLQVLRRRLYGHQPAETYPIGHTPSDLKMVAANTCHEGVETTSDEERQREEMEEMMAPCWGASDQEMEQPQPQPQISRAEQVSGITPTTQDSQQFGQVVETRAAIPQPRPLPSPPVFPPPANAGESVRPTVEDRRPKRVALDADDEDGSDDNGGHARKRCHGHSRRPSS